MGDPIDIGAGVTIKYWKWYGDPDDAPPGGIHETHPHAQTGEPCTGSLAFDTPNNHAHHDTGPFWTVESLEPLTLSPSVLCSVCGHHGWIRGGVWVSA